LAPDAEAEARLVVQHVVAALEAGVGGHEVVVVAFGGAAGRSRLADLLDAAGVPWSGPAATSLDCSPSGRVLLALLGLDAAGWTHQSVLAGLAAAPVAPGRSGALPLGRWGALARRANVVGGAMQWQERPAALAARLRHRGDESTALELDELAAFMAALAALLAPPEERSWTALAAWAVGLLDQLVDPAGGGWPADQVQAHGAVRAAVAGLAALDRVAGDPARAPGPADLLAALDARLAATPSPRTGRVGRGVLVVTDPADLLGAAPEVLLLAGVVEGAVPRRRADDPLVPEAEMGLVAGAPSRAVARAGARSALLAAVAAATRTVAFAHRADAQAARRPSRWFLRWAGALAGAPAPLGADDLELAAGPWLTVVPSFTATAMGAVAGSTQERRLAALAAVAVGAHRSALVRSPLVAGHPALRRAVTASLARRSDRFTAWDGLLDRRLDLDVDNAPSAASSAQETSATALEDWATCPQRYLLRHVLGVAPTEAPADALDVDGADRGALAHQVLAAVVRRGLGRPPTEPWGDDDRAFLVAELRRRAARLRADGRLGTGVLADLRIDELQAALLAALDRDDAERSEEGWVPAAVEAAFGAEAGWPVAVTLGSGRVVRFRGRIDRVDTAADGRVRVVDYKTGRGQRYVDAGSAGGAAAARLLQLAVYEAAARAAQPQATVSSGWWLLEAVNRAGQPLPVVPNHLSPDGFAAALEAITDGIESGAFPADPGEDGYRGPESCRFCPYDRVCRVDRVRALQRMADDPALAPWRALRSVGRSLAADDDPKTAEG
ncbi:MAG: PD-(D/E)XK nuclease family protein, partial [Acidimicrobiales bacterium]